MDEQVLDTPPAQRPTSHPPARDRRSEDAAKPEAPATIANVRAFGLAMLIAFALLALFNSSGLRSYVRDLPDGWVADELVVGADQWHELMQTLGPAHVGPAVRQVFERVRKISW